MEQNYENSDISKILKKHMSPNKKTNYYTIIIFGLLLIIFQIFTCVICLTTYYDLNKHTITIPNTCIRGQLCKFQTVIQKELKSEVYIH